VERDPSVAVIVPTVAGASHLPDLLTSLRSLDYGGAVETIVVDNASTDGTREIVGRFPDVHLLTLGGNRGFAGAVNEGARRAHADILAFVNDDMRVEPSWLTGLVDALRGGSSCVSGVILDWRGERVQFAGGIVNFHGAAAQAPFGQPLSRTLIEDGAELPFACGGSMAIERRLFLDFGGFDESYFAYFEDVDLGWRLRLAGHTIRLAGTSRCYHRHHSTGASLGDSRRAELYESNWLRTIVKNVDDDNLPVLLAASLVLAVERARLDPDPETARARLAAVAGVGAERQTLLTRRADVQARRKHSDEDVFALFGRPFFPAISAPSYLDAQNEIIRELELETMFPVGERFADELRRLAPSRSLPRRLAQRVRARRGHALLRESALPENRDCGEQHEPRLDRHREQGLDRD
jgi:GT2 family glycosyltransferase